MSIKIEYGTEGVRLDNAKKRIDVNRGRLSFAGGMSDDNHCIYNNGNNVDGEGDWDGMKMNTHLGLRIRTEGKVQKLEVSENRVKADVPVEAPRFKGAIQVIGSNEEPSEALAGVLRYKETNSGSELFICMKNITVEEDEAGSSTSNVNYVWRKIVEE